MKWSFRNILTLVAFLTFIPITALASLSETYTLSTNNLGLMGGPYATVVASVVNPTTVTFDFDAFAGYKIGSVGLNLAVDQVNFSWSSDPLNLFQNPKAKNMDGLGSFNYTFSRIGSEGLSGGVDNFTLTLMWADQSFNDLSQIIALNTRDNFIAAHILPLTGDTFYSTTPIPAAAWLLASGLLGLLGIRRRIQT